MTDHDRVLEARRAHVKHPGKPRCEECAKPWPCPTKAVLNALDHIQQSVRELRQKPHVPELQSRPGLPRLIDGKRDWRPNDERGHSRWNLGAAQLIDRIVGTVIRRADEDADGGISAAALTGSRSSDVSDPTFARVVAHEKIVRVDGVQTGRFWVDDQIPKAHDAFTNAIEEAGYWLSRAVEHGKVLYGISPNDARELVNRSGSCANDNCRVFKENNGDAAERLIVWDGDGRRRCEPCYRYVKKHSEERPAHLAQTA